MSNPGPETGGPNPYQSPDPEEGNQQSTYRYGAEPPAWVETDKDSRTWGMFCHLSSLSIFAGVPGFIGPLVIWLIKKDEMPFVDDQGKESLNFQIMLTICYLACVLFACVYIGFLMFPLVGLFHLIFTILATVKANEGVYYRYPINLRIIT